MWNFSNGACIQQFSRHNKEVTDLVYLPHSNQPVLASGWEGRLVCVISQTLTYLTKIRLKPCTSIRITCISLYCFLCMNVGPMGGWWRRSESEERTSYYSKRT